MLNNVCMFVCTLMMSRLLASSNDDDDDEPLCASSALVVGGAKGLGQGPLHLAGLPPKRARELGLVVLKDAVDLLQGRVGRLWQPQVHHDRADEAEDREEREGPG